MEKELLSVVETLKKFHAILLVQHLKCTWEIKALLVKGLILMLY